MLWIIWDSEYDDWLRELPSKVDDGGKAILTFPSRKAAEERAAKHVGYDTYRQAKADGWVEIVPLGVTCPAHPRTTEVVRK